MNKNQQITQLEDTWSNILKHALKYKFIIVWSERKLVRNSIRRKVGIIYLKIKKKKQTQKLKPKATAQN